MEVKDDFALRSLPCFCVVATRRIKQQAENLPFSRHVSSNIWVCVTFLYKRSDVFIPLSGSEAEAVANSESHTCHGERLVHATSEATCLEVTASLMLKLCCLAEQLDCCDVPLTFNTKSSDSAFKSRWAP